MGMDVEGINPVVRSKKPERPEDLFDETVVSKMECDKYFTDIEEYYRLNPGDYFRANVWGWRPLMEAMWESGACYDLPTKSWQGMAYNDGHGAPDQATCDRMIAKLEAWVELTTFDNDGAWTPEAFKEDTMLVTSSGCFISREEADLKGIETHSAYRLYKVRMEAWIKFLSECGGFKVW